MIPRPSYVVAKTREIVVENAAKWEWRQTAVAWFADKAGEEVRFVPEGDGTAFLKMTPGTRVYLGPGWQNRRDSYMFINQVRKGRLVVWSPVDGEVTLS